MLRASIDLGTNTALLLIADRDPKGGLRVVEDHAEIVRLGQEVDRTHRLHPDAMERTIACLRQYAERVRAHGIEPGAVIAVGTSSSRDATNGAEFYVRIEKETGFRFRVISGEEEARASFLGGLLPGMDPAKHAVIDVGGGSTEYVALSGSASSSAVLLTQSLDIGSVRFTERYLKSDPVSDQEFWACRDAFDQEISALRDSWRGKLPRDLSLVAVAGTATTLASWFLGLEKFDAARIDGIFLARGDLHRQVEELKMRSVEERQALVGLEAKRADVILAGAMILWRSCEILGFSGISVSSRGLRYGLVQSGV